QAECIGELERQDDVAVSDLCPPELDLQSGLEKPNHLPIHVVHRGCEKQQSTNQPTTATDGNCGVGQRLLWSSGCRSWNQGIRAGFKSFASRNLSSLNMAVSHPSSGCCS